MNYNELLNQMSQQMTEAASVAKVEAKKASSVSTPKEDTTATLLNKIGLEVQRQGG